MSYSQIIKNGVINLTRTKRCLGVKTNTLILIIWSGLFLFGLNGILEYLHKLSGDSDAQLITRDYSQVKYGDIHLDQSTVKTYRALVNQYTRVQDIQSDITERIKAEQADEWESLFFKVNFTKEKELAKRGNIFHYLKQYANPCWISRFPKSWEGTDAYKNSSYVQQVISREYFYGKKRSEEVKQFTMNMTVRMKNGQNHRPRCIPSVYLIGSSKSGTADLFQKINMHPDMHLPAIKEPHWWTLGRFGYGSLGKQSFSTYLDNFDMAAAKINSAPRIRNGKTYYPGKTIDASTWYLYQFPWTQIPGNKGLREPKYILAHTIKALYPNAKILAILRQPTDRLYSHWRMIYPDASPEKFHNVTREVVKRFRSCLKTDSLRTCAYSYRPLADHQGMLIHGSIYYPFVKDWMTVFGERQMMVIQADDYYKDRVEVLKNVYNFLGLEPMDNEFWDAIARSDIANTKEKNKRSTAKMKNETRTILDSFFEPFNAKMADFMKDDKWHWSN